jgi:hypothetical protein
MTKRPSLVCQHPELVSGTVLERFQKEIRSYVSRRHGIYALYRKDRLYYVGLARNLRGRLRAHLRDRHAGCWDRCSVYLTIGDQHLRELESLVLRIVRPDGNKHRGRFTRSEDLKRRLARDLKASAQRDLDEVLGRPRTVRRKESRNRPRGRAAKYGRRALAQVLPHGVPLVAVFKKRQYRARARKDGRVRVNGKLYDSPSAAATAVRKKPTNGWSFWRYERAVPAEYSSPPLISDSGP